MAGEAGDRRLVETVTYSKEEQISRSPGGNRLCTYTGEPKRSCKCAHCRGRRARAKGQVKQRQARKQAEKAFRSTAGPSVTATANEENWRLPVRMEVKAGRYASAVDTFYRNTKAQSDLSKAIGDTRPFLGVAMVDGSRDGLAVIRMSDLQSLFDELRRGDKVSE